MTPTHAPIPPDRAARTRAPWGRPVLRRAVRAVGAAASVFATVFALRPAALPAQEAPVASKATAPAPAQRRLADSTLTINTLRLVLPPAAVLAGSTPAIVQRAGTPQVLAASLLSAAGQGGGVPDGVAFETSPWWVFPHRAVATGEYFRASPANLWRNASFSFAAQRGDSAAGAAGPQRTVALGARTLIVNTGARRRAVRERQQRTGRLVLDASPLRVRADRARPRADTARARLDTVRGRLAALDAELADAGLAVLVASDAERPGVQQRVRGGMAERARLRLTRDSLQAIIDAYAVLRRRADSAYAAASDSSYASTKDAADPAKANAGFTLEVAAGWRTFFPEGRWQGGRSDGVALWVTPSYRHPNSDLAWTLVGRYLANVREYDGDDVRDAGGRLDYVRDQLTVGAEVVYRSLAGRTPPTGAAPQPGGRAEDATRWAANVQYKLLENTQLVGSFGSDFRKATGRPVLSTLALTVGFGAVALRADDATPTSR